MAKPVISIIHCRLCCVVLEPTVNRRERSTECVASLNTFGPQFYMQRSYLFHIKWKTQANLCDKSQPTRWITEPNAKQHKFSTQWICMKMVRTAKKLYQALKTGRMFLKSWGVQMRVWTIWETRHYRNFRFKLEFRIKQIDWTMSKIDSLLLLLQWFSICSMTVPWKP